MKFNRFKNKWLEIRVHCNLFKSNIQWNEKFGVRLKDTSIYMDKKSPLSRLCFNFKYCPNWSILAKLCGSYFSIENRIKYSRSIWFQHVLIGNAPNDKTKAKLIFLKMSGISFEYQNIISWNIFILFSI